jgi:hypothetical protein
VGPAATIIASVITGIDIGFGSDRSRELLSARSSCSPPRFSAPASAPARVREERSPRPPLRRRPTPRKAAPPSARLMAMTASRASESKVGPPTSRRQRSRFTSTSMPAGAGTGSWPATRSRAAFAVSLPSSSHARPAIRSAVPTRWRRSPRGSQPASPAPKPAPPTSPRCGSSATGGSFSTAAQKRRPTRSRWSSKGTAGSWAALPPRR